MNISTIVGYEVEEIAMSEASISFMFNQERVSRSSMIVEEMEFDAFTADDVEFTPRIPEAQENWAWSHVPV